MKDSKIVLALLTACALGMAGPVMAKGAIGGGLDGHQRAERNAKAERQARREQRTERKAEQRQSRRQDRAGKDAAVDRRSERRERRAERVDQRPRHREASWRSEREHHGRRDSAQRRDLYRRDAGYPRGERRKQTVGDGWSERRGHGEQSRFEHRIDRRLAKQHDRVRHGWKSGEISRKELKRIRKDRHKIAHMDRRFGSDGHYTRHERRKLNRAMDRASQRIYRTKHNYRIAGVERGRAYRR
jgi:hypothetical protein